MAIPVANPGDVLTAAFVNTWLAPQAVYKPSTQTVTSSTALVNDTALALAVVANAQYAWTCWISYTGGTLAASDLKVSFTFPAGAFAGFQVDGYNTAGNDLSRLSFDLTGFPLSMGTEGTGTHRGMTIAGAFTTGVTAGTLQLQWAQVTSNATGTSVFNGSYMMLQRIG